MDIRKLTSIANYFVIVHGNSDRHVRAIALHVMDALKTKKVPLWHEEGLETPHWILLDYGSVIVHVFYRKTREFYGLERLWGDAPRL
ncbi:MAG: ribosome silencing factor [Candidatus Omnitrophica bacterium]|nr:ribosome silencing factor [Candidatus Omnitrophota bacterium]